MALVQIVIVLILSLLVIGVAFAPLDWLLERRTPFWLTLMLYAAWFTLWMVCVPAFIAYELGWLE
jgi:hypothetical protein